MNKDSLQLTDTQSASLITPYKMKLDSLMSEVLCYNEQDLNKQLPEGTLGNFVCDELMEYAVKNYNKPVDFCIYNYGGLRVGSIAKGNISVGKIFELAPFDNYLVVVELEGADCKKLFDLVAENNGTPCSKELRLSINNNKIVNAAINNVSFDENKTYTIITNDYVANGGDKTEPMKNAKALTNLNILVRDALINNLRIKGKNGQSIKVSLDGRVEQVK